MDWFIINLFESQRKEAAMAGKKKKRGKKKKEEPEPEDEYMTMRGEQLEITI